MPQTTSPGQAGELLDKVDRRRAATRARVRGAWLPLTLFGCITLATIPLYRRPFAYPHCCGGFRSGPSVTPYVAGLPGARSQLVAYLYWLVAAPVGYALCAAWYQRRARGLGLALRWERYVGAGVCLFVLLALLYLVPQRHLPGARSLDPDAFTAFGVLSPLVAVALALFALGWIERSWPVAVVATLFGGLTVIINTYGPGQIPPWVASPHGATKDFFVAPAHDVVLLAAILFAGAAGTGLAAWRSRAAG